MIGNETDANSVAHVILTAKSDGKVSATGAPAGANAPNSCRFPAVRATAHTLAAGCDASPTRNWQGQQRAQEVSTPFVPAFGRE